MNSIGATLRQERLRRGLDLIQIAEQTRINASLLEAIESDDLAKLPGAFFARSFVRQYARALNLDENELEADLQRQMYPEPPATTQQTARREIGLPKMSDGLAERLANQRSLGSLAAFLVIMAACSVIYVAWQRTREAPKTAAPAATVQPAAPAVAPASFEQQKPAPPPQSALPAKPEAAEPAAAKPAAEASKPPATEAAKPVAAEAPKPAVTEPPPTPAAAETGEPAPIKVELRATEPVWIRVVGDGKVRYIGVLQPGQSRAFAGAQQLSVRTGNAGGLEASWNGQSLGALGPEGQIRVAEFTPEKYTVTPPPTPAPVNQ